MGANNDHKELLRELLARELAKRTICGFVKYIDVPGAPVVDDESLDWIDQPINQVLSAHHLLMCDEIQKCMETDYSRLMLFLPPGSAKSTYASMVAPAWYLGKYAGKKCISTSYGTQLSTRLGRKCRSITRQPKYVNLFDASLKTDNFAAHDWSLSNDSEYFCGGLMSGLTGNRADLLIIDDPVKGRAEAESSVIRESTLRAFNDDAKTRLKPSASIILVQTRWHQDDLAGSILPEGYKGKSGLIKCRDGMTWTVLNIPAECERADDPLGRGVGEMLWPEYFTKTHWDQYRQDDRSWSSLFQQRPTPSQGDIFKPEKIEIVDAIPAGIFDGLVRGWDFASSKKGDWTAGVKIAKLKDGRYLIIDSSRLKAETNERDDLLITTTRNDTRACTVDFPQDPGQAGKSQVVYFTRALDGYKVQSSTETGSKIERAELFASQLNAGNVLMLRGAWNSAFIDELRTFPNGTNDDQIDAASRAYAALLTIKKSFAPMSVGSLRRG